MAANTTTTDTPTWTGWSAHALLLPYIEQSALYNAANFNWTPDGGYPNPTALSAEINQTVTNTVLSTYLCPSDGNAGASNSRINNYYASMGPDIRDNPTSPSGLFGRDVPWGERDCRDGTSNTVAFSESLVGLLDAGNKYKANFTLGAANTNPDHNSISNVAVGSTALPALFESCMQSFNSNSNIRDDKGARWASGRVGFTLFNTVAVPNDARLSGGVSCRIGCSGCYSDTSAVVPASSNHAGGVNVLCADGSTKFIKDTVNPSVWWALGSKNSGEVVSSDSY